MLPLDLLVFGPMGPVGWWLARWSVLRWWIVPCRYAERYSEYEVVSRVDAEHAALEVQRATKSIEDLQRQNDAIQKRLAEMEEEKRQLAVKTAKLDESKVQTWESAKKAKKGWGGNRAYVKEEINATTRGKKNYGGTEYFVERLLKHRETVFSQQERAQKKAEALLLLCHEQSRDKLTDEEDAEFRLYTGEMKTLAEELAKIDESILQISDEVERSAHFQDLAQRLQGAQRVQGAMMPPHQLTDFAVNINAWAGTLVNAITGTITSITGVSPNAHPTFRFTHEGFVADLDELKTKAIPLTKADTGKYWQVTGQAGKVFVWMGTHFEVATTSWPNLPQLEDPSVALAQYRAMHAPRAVLSSKTQQLTGMVQNGLLSPPQARDIDALERWDHT